MSDSIINWTQLLLKYSFFCGLIYFSSKIKQGTTVYEFFKAEISDVLSSILISLLKICTDSL